MSARMSASRPPDAEPISAEGLEALKRELHELETTGRRAIAQRILIARGHGDLSENAEYHAAKEDQAHMETRIKRLQQRLRSAVVTEIATDRSPDVDHPRLRRRQLRWELDGRPESK